MALQANDLFHGRYRLIEERGRGSFGEVWLARDEELDLEVAVKIYIALDDRGIEEFKEEYRTVFELRHSNILRADHYDVCDRRPYLVMSYCPESASSLIGLADEQVVWQFIGDVSRGLAYLHGKEIIHRDIKPDNILRDADGSFVITDFGISKRMRSTLRRNSTRGARDVDVSGTIGYMAPELFSAEPDAVKATDIWALGATIYEMVTGELPFMGQGGVMLLHGAEVPTLGDSYSEELNDIVSASLSLETWCRPTAEELSDYAQAHLSGKRAPMPWLSRSGGGDISDGHRASNVGARGYAVGTIRDESFAGGVSIENNVRRGDETAFFFNENHTSGVDNRATQRYVQSAVGGNVNSGRNSEGTVENYDANQNDNTNVTYHRVTFGKAVRSCLKHFFSCKGRASRAEYWFFCLFCLITCPLIFIWMFPIFCVTVRRLHDIGRRGAAILILLVPGGIGALILFIWLMLGGDEGSNKYGPDPHYY